MRTNIKLLFTSIFLAGSLFVWAQQKTITGQVTDSDGFPVADAYVYVEGSENGVYTDANGNYTLSVNEGDQVAIEYIGFETKNVSIGNEMQYNVSIDRGGAIELQETIVTALGIEKKKDDDLSSSSVVDTDVLQRSGESGVLQGLSGKAAGVNITKNNGDPGAGAFIQLRGQNSISGSASPLIVIDGVIVSNSDSDGNPGSLPTEGVSQQSRLNDINPDDIESISVIKGAAAAAVYGTDAGNGVIVITTKQGKGKRGWSVNLSSSYQFDEINEKWEKQNIYGQGYDNLYLGFGSPYVGSRRSFYAGTSWGDKISNRTGGADIVDTSGGYFQAEDGTIYYPYAVNADGTITKNSTETYNDSNFDQVFRIGSTYNTNVSLSHNGEDSNSFLSLGYWDQDGIVKGSDYERITARFNHTQKISDRLTFKIFTNYIYNQSERVQQGSNLNGLYLGYLRTPADFDNSDYIGTYYDADGSPTLNSHRGFRDYLGIAAPSYNNPGWTINRQANPSELNRFIITPEFNYLITDKISLTARYGIDYYEDTRYTFFPYNSAAGYATGLFRRDGITEKTESANVFLNGLNTITDNFEISWVVGYLMNVNKYERLSGQSQDFTNPFASFPDYRNFGNATAENISAEDYHVKTKKHAIYGTANFELYRQFLVELTGRYESPSTLQDESIFFPSASLGWKFSENFDSNALSFGKLRASYGEVAVEPQPYLISGSGYNTAVVSSSWGDELEGSFYGNPFERGPVAPNPNLVEERIKEFEIGADLRFINDRFGVNFTYYDRKTEDVILEQGLAASTGYTSIFRNAGEITNKGIEIDFNGDLVKTNDFRFQLFGTYAQNENEAIVENEGEIFLAGFTGTSSVALNGQPVGILYGGRWLRDDDGQILLDANGFPDEDSEAGVIGDPNPDWRGSIGSEMSWKGLRLSALIDTSQGNDVWNGTRGVMYFFGVHPDTANEVVVSAAEAAEIVNFNGDLIQDLAHATQNADGTYTVRGHLQDYGAGTVLLDQEWYTQRGGGFGNVDEQFVEDGSWVKLREISLFYSTPKKFTDMIGLSNLEIGVTGRNLVTWTSVEGFDPESNLTGATRGRGLEYFTNPSTKTYLFTLKIGF